MKTSPSNPSGLLRLAHQLGSVSALGRLLLAAAAGAAAYLLTPPAVALSGKLIAAWDAFAGTSLLLLWLAILTTAPARIRQVATDEDPGRVASFIVVVLGACASFLGVGQLLHTMHQLPPAALLSHVALAVGGVASAWLLLHTVFTLRYAHLFYDPATDDHGRAGGLDFPGGNQDLDYLDFAYFAFVVGMTAQTADVGVSGRTIRRITLLHGVLSFGFNTAVVALSISALAGLI